MYHDSTHTRGNGYITAGYSGMFTSLGTVDSPHKTTRNGKKATIYLVTNMQLDWLERAKATVGTVFRKFEEPASGSCLVNRVKPAKILDCIVVRQLKLVYL